MITKVVRLDETEVANETGGTHWVERIPKVGDEMILHPRLGHDPVITGNVSRVTKTQFRVTGTDGKEYGPFKLESGWSRNVYLKEDGAVATYEDQRDPKIEVTNYCWTRFEHHVRKSYDKYTRCEFKCQFLVDLVEREKAEAIRRAAEKNAAAEKQRQEYAEEKARQLKEVQDACGSLEGELPPMIKKVMPDGSRVYFASIPVKPCLRERKAGWEEVIIRCKDVEDFDWDNPRDPETGERNVVVKVEAHYTYINGSSSSFSLVSGSKFDSDEDAVWNAIRDRYHWR